MTPTFSRDVLDLDLEAVAERLSAGLSDAVLKQLKRRGVVVAVSGGIDSACVAALAVRALGPKRVFGLLLPERDSSSESTEYARKLNEDIVRLISEKKSEPEWLLEWRLEAYRRWLNQPEPDWAMVSFPPIDYQNQYYYAQPKSFKERPKSLDEVDPELLKTYEKLGIPLKEQMILAGVEGAGAAVAEGRLENSAGRKIAVDAVFDSVSVATTFKAETRAKAGVIFCSISEAVKDLPGAGEDSISVQRRSPTRDNKHA